MVSFFGSASVLLLTLCLDAYSLPAYILPVQKFALQPFPLTNARLNRPNLRNNGHMAPRKIETQLDFDASMTTALEAGIAIGGSYLLLQLGAYWRMQFVTAGIISGIPAASSIVELDAKDGKTVFYLPKKAFYTAVMSQGDSKDPLVIKEKKRFNEQLILECIGKANRYSIYTLSSGMYRKYRMTITRNILFCTTLLLFFKIRIRHNLNLYFQNSALLYFAYCALYFSTPASAPLPT